MARRAVAVAVAVAALSVAAGCKRSRGGAERGRELEALPYLNLAEDDSAREGVVVFDRARAQPGLNLFTSRVRGGAWLMDDDGAIVHAWSLADRGFDQTGFGHVELSAADELYVVKGDRGVFKLDWDGNLVWAVEVRAHHDMAFRPDGGSYVLTRGRRDVEHAGETLPILDDAITALSADGAIEGSISVYDLFGDRIAAEQFDAIRRQLAAGGDPRLERATPHDVFHTNRVEILDRDIPGIARAGDLLLGVRHLDLVAIVDSNTREVVWEYTGSPLQKPHDPTLLPSGTILIFDNGVERGASRVIEVDPASQQIVWSYGGDRGAPFYTEKRGSAQRLPNGNTLIAESDRGRAFEVTASGEIVWEYLMRKQSATERETLYRMRRIVGERAERLRARASRK